MREGATKLMATLMASQMTDIRIMNQDGSEIAERSMDDPAFQITLETCDWREPPMFPTGPALGKKDRAQIAAAKRIAVDPDATETRQQRRARERKEAKK